MDLSINLIDYSVIREVSLPFPYSTNCLNYEENINSLESYRSKQDCIVKYLEQKEYSECDCDKRWSFGGLGIGNSSNKCNKCNK